MWITLFSSQSLLVAKLECVVIVPARETAVLSQALLSKHTTCACTYMHSSNAARWWPYEIVIKLNAWCYICWLSPYTNPRILHNWYLILICPHAIGREKKGASHASCIPCFGFTGVIILCFIFTRQVRELKNYVLWVVLESSSSSRSTSSSTSISSSSKSSSFSDLEVSSCFPISYSSFFKTQSKSLVCLYHSIYVYLSEDTQSMSWCI